MFWPPVKRGPEQILKQHTNYLHLHAGSGSKITHKRTHETPKYPIAEGRFNMKRKVCSVNKYLLSIYYVLR